MDKAFSTYLDATRFLAALFVVVSHFVSLGLIDETTSYFIPDLGREAVMIFFVLSGYVIAYTTENKSLSPTAYAIARASRIYSVALPCLLLAFLSSYLFETYSENFLPHYQVTKSYIYIPFHSLFLGELWSLTERPPWLVPYWSLSYEVWYYVLFGVFYFSKGLTRIILTTLILLIVGYKLWLLLPVWVSGVLFFKYQGKFTIKKTYARLLWVLSIVALCSFKVLDFDIFLRHTGNELWQFSGFPLGSADRFISDYVVCIIVLINFYSALYSQFNFITNYRRVIQKVAAYTFTLYLLHALVMEIWMRLVPHNPTSMLDISLLIFTIGLSTYFFGFFTEQKRHHFTVFFEYLSHAIYRIINKFNINSTKAN